MIIGGGDEAWDELVGEAKTYMKELREQDETYVPPPGRGKNRGAPDEVAANPSDNVMERAEALAEVLASFRALAHRMIGGHHNIIGTVCLGEGEETCQIRLQSRAWWRGPICRSP